jgi:haloalkane dehalogenase
MTMQHHDVGTAQIAVRTSGNGPPLLFVHGWPLHGATWRNVVPLMEATRTCVVIDLPGCGETKTTDANDFTFRGQAANLARLLDKLPYERVDVLAQDTGATIARQLALIAPTRIGKMALINTEIPHHRPPWIELFQTTTALPGAALSFQLLMRSRAFLRSSMGFGGCFVDKSLIDGEFRSHFVQPLIDDGVRMKGIIRYLRGIDWQLVDGLATEHAKIESEVLFIWGVDDPTFPFDRAQPMQTQLKKCAGFVRVEGAKLLPHEEKPADVAKHALAFFS